MPLRGPVGIMLGRHLARQIQQTAHMLDHRRGDLVQLREMPQPLIRLQPHHQGQQMLIALRLLPCPRDLGDRRRERLSQLPRGNHPLEPRIRGAIDRRHNPDPEQKTDVTHRSLSSTRGPILRGFCYTELITCYPRNLAVQPP
jgi:hypothetical protein